jgi:hypothetical protein
MDIWTAAIVIVPTVLSFELIKYAIKMKHQRPAGLNKNAESKLEQLERRIESLESIIIDLERDKRFRDL